MQYFIFGNYGDNTIATITFAAQKQLQNLTVVNIDTGWGAENFQARILQGQNYAKQQGFSVVTLKSSHSFSELARERKSFPSAKFQWCTSFLKALPFIAWLDEVDAACEACIILGARRKNTKRQLSEFIEESEHYGDRKLWSPLLTATDDEYNQLLKISGLTKLNHRSLECFPCVHSELSVMTGLTERKITEINLLEQEIGQTMFHARYSDVDIKKLSQFAIKNKEETVADLGCGSWYACGE